MPSPTAEIISIGDEMTSGARLDTNSQWLCQQMGELGIVVRFKSMVGDSLQDNVDVFRIAASRADFVIATGGLGPTADDLTRDSLALLVDRPLVLNAAALSHIESLFVGRGREMPASNRCQAMFPEGAMEIFNPRGTAPGIDLVVDRPDGGQARVFALPGVPAEMKEMFIATVVPRIVDQIGGQRRVIRQAIVKCFGLGESDMEARLGEMISRTRSPRVGITVSAATISLRITAEADDSGVCEAMIAETRREIDVLAGEFVFGEGEGCELQHVVAEILQRRGQRMVTVEIGHAAPLAGWLADVVPRAVYAGGSIESSVDHSSESLRRRLQAGDADWALVVDRYPTLHTDDDLVAELLITLCGRKEGEYWQTRQRLGGHPGILHARIGKAALAFARSVWLRSEPSGHETTTPQPG